MKLKFVIIFLIAFAIFGCSNKKKNEENNASKANIQIDYSKPVTLSLINGKSVKLQKKNGGLVEINNNKNLILFFMTTWCAPCNAELNVLKAIEKNYSDKVTILGILLENSNIGFLQNFMKTNGVNFDIAIGKNNKIIKKIVDVRAIPYIAIYDANGTKFDSYTGLIPYEMLETEIREDM